MRKILSFTVVFLLFLSSCKNEKTDNEQEINKKAEKIIKILEAKSSRKKDSITKKDSIIIEKQIEFTINGYVSDYKSNYVILKNRKNKKIDSARINNFEFNLTGKVSKPDLYTLQLQKDTIQHLIILENSPYRVLIQDYNASIIGGILQNKYSNYLNKKRIFDDKKAKLYDQFSDGLINLNTFLSKVNNIKSDEKLLLNNLIAQNHYNVISDMMISKGKFTSEELTAIKKRIKRNKKNSGLVAKINSKISNLKVSEQKEKISKRPPVPMFAGINPEGRKTHLKDIIRNKKVFLIDFWASWCPPCRQASPRLRQLYARYYEKGFDILTVSEDRSVVDWKNGIIIDNIDMWHHIYDDFNRISSMFGVGALPHLVLIDENARIIKNKISINELENYLIDKFGKGY